MLELPDLGSTLAGVLLSFNPDLGAMLVLETSLEDDDPVLGFSLRTGEPELLLSPYLGVGLTFGFSPFLIAEFTTLGFSLTFPPSEGLLMGECAPGTFEEAFSLEEFPPRGFTTSLPL